MKQLFIVFREGIEKHFYLAAVERTEQAYAPKLHSSELQLL